jgi:DNA-binding transcriptional MerR regulator
VSGSAALAPPPAATGVARLLRIGDVAQQVGTTPRTIRYYEEMGLLEPAAGRAAGAHRTYTEQSVERLSHILRLKQLLGVSLDELSDIIEAEDARAALRAEWRAGASATRRRVILTESVGHIDRQLALVRARVAELEGLERELSERRARSKRLLRAEG